MSRGYKSFASRRRAELSSGGTLVTTRAGTVEYAELGPYSGLPVLFFPGGLAGHDQTRLLSPLAAAGCRVIGWSRPGYLRTPLTTGSSFAEQADAAAALLDELGVPAAVAYGISGGGPMAIEFARRHPAMTRGLVLESAVSRRYAPKISPLARALFLTPRGAWLTTRFARRRPRAYAAGFVRQESTLDRRRRRQVVEWILADSGRRTILQAVTDLITPYEDRAAGSENDLRRWAALDDSLTAGVRCPTLVLHGSHDGDVDPAHARHSAATIPDARLHIVEEGWHLLPLSMGGGSAYEATCAFLGIDSTGRTDR
ncbi:alpha/beta fold hydrolase [Streptomyces abyssalis]|uniref:alpha/beta fold hydrolase n=1 Tax=Streptomyces abyssalis TaxID=933944 RepID=UPI00085C8CFE|nr:alpha/beta hydrolase [Streptomyces abyssalis]